MKSNYHILKDQLDNGKTKVEIGDTLAKIERIYFDLDARCETEVMLNSKYIKWNNLYDRACEKYNKAKPMKHKLSRRQKILVMFSVFPDRKLSCQDICKKLIKSEKLTDNIALYLSGSISSILRKMVIDGTLVYAKGKAIRGGHLYQKNRKSKQTKQK